MNRQPLVDEACTLPLSCNLDPLSRHLLYWMIEDFPADWREETLGCKLMELIDKMMVHLAREKLPNYFIRKQVSFA